VCKNDIVLGSVAREICRVIDFEQSNVHRRFYPQPGINEELDRSMLIYNSRDIYRFYFVRIIEFISV